MAKRIGITGGIGAGKSVVSKIIESMGFPVFNSDDVAKSFLETDAEVKSLVIDLAGSEVYQDGRINRKKLAELVFKNEDVRTKVNSIIHPRVRKSFSTLAATSPSKLVFNEAAILFETGAYQQFDATILVVAPEELRIARVVERDNVTTEEVRSRMRAQWTDQEKEKLATYVLINDETKPLIIELEKIIAELTN